MFFSEIQNVNIGMVARQRKTEEKPIKKVNSNVFSGTGTVFFTKMEEKANYLQLPTKTKTLQKQKTKLCSDTKNLNQFY